MSESETPTLRQASLTLTPACGFGTKVAVGGHDITDAVRVLTLDAHIGEPHLLTLGLTVFTVETEADGARVVVDDRTREALLALGWTPPDGGPAGGPTPEVAGG